MTFLGVTIAVEASLGLWVKTSTPVTRRAKTPTIIIAVLSFMRFPYGGSKPPLARGLDPKPLLDHVPSRITFDFGQKLTGKAESSIEYRLEKHIFQRV